MSTPPAGTSLVDILAALRRRRWPVLIAIACVLPLAVAAALLWPATYRSTATILIEQQEIPTDLVRSTISSFADQRLQVINQRVMTTANLMRIIEKYNLYATEQASEPRETVIARMRDRVQLSMISADVVDPRAGRPVKATIAFTLSFDDPSAGTAAQVANELTTLYLNENIESRKQLTANTTGFLNEEAGRLSDTISLLEAQVSAFKQEHADNLPSLGQLNVQLMSRIEEDQRGVDARLLALDQQLLYLDAQLAQVEPVAQLTAGGTRILSPADRLKAARSEYVRASAVYSPDHPDVLRLQREIGGLEREAGTQESSNDLARQLADARSQLTAARQRYGADHPDVARLERLVESAESAMQAAPATAAPLPAEKPDNPVYIQLNTQRETVLSERASLRQRRAELSARLGDFERRLAESPEVERAYGTLIRELEGSQQKYREVRQKQLEAQLAQNLESESKGERFTLIEPPLPAEKPFTPNRVVIFVLGCVLALVAGVGVLVLLEILDTSIRGAQDLERLLTAPPLAVVPWMLTDEDRARRRRQRRYAFVGTVGSVVIAIVAAHFFYRPLDVLWAVALRKLGG